jgi:hypothetical protein
MVYEIDPTHRIQHRLEIAHITNIEFKLVTFILSPHIVLLFLVAAKYADFPQIRINETSQNSIAKRSRTP